jgi:hypothetical protein
MLIRSLNYDMCYLKIVRLAIEMVYIGLSFRWVIESPKRLLGDEIFPFEIRKCSTPFYWLPLI